MFGWLFGKVGQPPVVGEILAGVILGPSLLGRLYPAAIQTMLTPKTTAVLSAIAQVGLVLLMLLIGLEFPFDRLRQAARASIFVAVAGIVVPFAASYALAGYLYRLAPGSPPPPSSRSGCSSRRRSRSRRSRSWGASSSTRGLTRTRMGLTSITAAAIDDVLGWILLGAVVSMVTHGKADLGALGVSLVGVAILGVAFWALGPLRPLAARSSGAPRPAACRRTSLAVVLVVVFAAATATNALGVFSIFGGFLCGIAGSFNPDLREADPRLDRRPRVGAAPADLLRLLGAADRHGLAGIGSAALGGAPRSSWRSPAPRSSAPRRSRPGPSGLPWKESLSIGLLMNTRALMALVVINIGADMGVISPGHVLLAGRDGALHDGDHDADPAPRLSRRPRPWSRGTEPVSDSARAG